MFCETGGQTYDDLWLEQSQILLRAANLLYLKLKGKIGEGCAPGLWVLKLQNIVPLNDTNGVWSHYRQRHT